MTPAGKGDLKHALELLEADSLEHGHPLCMLGVTPDAKDILEEALPGGFFYIPERDYFDYIYQREDLALLKGKKFQSSVTISIISRKDMNTNTPPSLRN